MARTARLETRLSPNAQALVKRAAEIQGRSVSDFVVSAAQEAARKVISEVELIHLSRAGQERFADLLLKPSPPKPALRKAMKRRRQLLGE